MLSISVWELVLMVAVLPLLGGVIGYAVGGDRARREIDDSKIEALQQEFDSYRGGVAAHFEQTASVMHQMTEQYRTLYLHMAQSAVDLCDSQDELPKLEEFRRPGLGVAAESAAEVAPGEPEQAAGA